MRLESLHENIGRNFKYYIRYEKDGKCNVALDAHKTQVFSQVHRQGIADVDAESTNSRISETETAVYRLRSEFTYRSRKAAT